MKKCRDEPESVEYIKNRIIASENPQEKMGFFMKTNDRSITDLMASIYYGKTQLPDFQRGWVWDDNRIKALIASITNGYPVGAAMFLEYGNESIRFKYRTIEGAPENENTPDELILDGQQRLTSIYNALYGEKPVKTKTDKGQEITRYYYIDMVAALDNFVDRVDAITSVPETRVVTSDFGRKVELDLSSPQKEYEQKMFPLNSILNPGKYAKWQNDFLQYHNYDGEATKLFMDFLTNIIVPLGQYTLPVITLDKNTPKEAVCQVFENVNTGGVSLTVFELVTAIFAMSNFELRNDWEKRKKNYFNGEILHIVSATDLLTACTLLSTYQLKGTTASCKKKDVLALTLEEYEKNVDKLCEGFLEAEKILEEERIFSSKDLPYSTQLIPMAVLCTLLSENNQIKVTNVKDKLKKWYWCGVFGEMYGGANETRYVQDVVGVMEWINNDEFLPKTIQESYFNPGRLLTLQSRQSAAYKGIMALILKNHCKDFISGREMDFTVYKAESIDIHHIFPRDYCEKQKYPKEKWNSVVNKTPISYSTNREIGGVAPSKYLEKIERKGQVSSATLDQYLQTHYIDYAHMRTDNFNAYFIKRAIAILNAIEDVTGKTIAGRDSEQVLKEFGESLARKTFDL